MKDKGVFKTKSGLITRYDVGLGLLVFSPYSGLVFGVQEIYVTNVAKWLDRRTKDPPSEEFRKALGFGWDASCKKAEYPTPHLLPSSGEAWPILDKPKYPILFNWFLTGMCPLACKYCYAEDLMRDPGREPKKGEIERIAETILSYNPLVVVVTGGDPLCSEHLPKAIRLLHGKVGIVLDTSGYTLKPEHISLFKKYNVVVRISLDTARPQVNNKQRPVLSKTGDTKSHNTLNAAVKALSACLNADLSVAVQSVATKNTANDLLALGDNLYRIGVKSWRVFKVQPSKVHFEEYKELVKPRGQKTVPYPYVFKQLRTRCENVWEKEIALQITHDETPNSVILVSPDGKFYTESNLNPGKVLLDDRNQTHPSLASIFDKVDMHAHAKRYLNLTFPGQKSKSHKGGS